jgi:hypothetical protein
MNVETSLLKQGKIVHIFQPKQGLILGEDDYVDQRPEESLMKCLEYSFQHKEKMPKASNETEEYRGFHRNYLCELVFVGYEECKEKWNQELKRQHCLMKVVKTKIVFSQGMQSLKGRCRNLS